MIADVYQMFNIQPMQTYALFSPDDEHHTRQRVIDYWKYGASLGVSGTPTAIVNGVMLDKYPKSEEEWTSILDQFIS